jgi:hypothetical protein
MDAFTSEIFEIQNNVWNMGFEVPAQVVTKYLGKDYKRVKCTLNGAHTFQCALMPLGDGRYFINVNTAIQKKLNLSLGDKVSAEVEPDTSKYGLPMPEELEALLEIDPEGDRIFHSLTPGKQRNLLHIVGLPKSSEIRVKKAMVVVEYLKEVNGKLDFKELNQAFKNANRKG